MWLGWGFFGFCVFQDWLIWFLDGGIEISGTCFGCAGFDILFFCSFGITKNYNL